MDDLPSSRPSYRRVALVGLALPAAVVTFDQVAWIGEGGFRGGESTQALFFLWLVLKAAILSWCAGAYLGLTAYGWVVFLWCQLLLDVHTFAASHGALGHQFESLAHTLLSSQVGFLVAWTVLGATSLPWRVVSLLAALAAIVFHAQTLDVGWPYQTLPMVQWLAAGMVLLIGLALRVRGFSIRRVELGAASANAGQTHAFQFGVKHMLAWTAALAPLLIVLRTTDLRTLSGIALGDAYPICALSVCIAMTTLAAFWLALGSGAWGLRLLGAAAIVGVTSQVLIELGVRWTPAGNRWNWRSNQEFYVLVVEMGDLWRPWLAMLTSLLAGMLLFLHGSGYRLAKTDKQSSTPDVD